MCQPLSGSGLSKEGIFAVFLLFRFSALVGQYMQFQDVTLGSQAL